MDKHDIFYYAKLNGIPIYFQVTLYKKTIKREEIKS